MASVHTGMRASRSRSTSVYFPKSFDAQLRNCAPPVIPSAQRWQTFANSRPNRTSIVPCAGHRRHCTGSEAAGALPRRAGAGASTTLAAAGRRGETWRAITIPCTVFVRLLLIAAVLVEQRDAQSRDAVAQG